ncbi:MAG: tRNA uridine-5-carboxymethylaminomethyl(34) synthesis GTPase MnmE, partial [Caldiserica bacterium]
MVAKDTLSSKKEPDTIVALSTPPGKSAIALIRTSGEKSIDIVEKIFRSKTGVKLKDLKSHRIIYGEIYDGKNVIDDVIVSIMRKPKSYTGENMVEISTHGNPIIVEKIIKILIKNGARIALPGEFTKRAFLNGKMDLTEAEAVAELINSETEKELEIARRKLKGELKRRIESIENKILDVLSQIEAYIEFPLEEIKIESYKTLKEKLKKAKDELLKLISTYESGRKLKEGIKICITGKPNVGKSTLFNILLQKEKAIVTEIPGTTRDILEGRTVIDGLLFNFLDTAGIRKGISGKIESIAIEKAKKELK